MAGKLDGILLQFPWSFRPGPGSRGLLTGTKEALPEHRLFVEFRNAAWNRPETFAQLQDAGIGYCVVDEPQLPGLMPPSVELTTAIGYVRFHGRNRATWWSREGDRERDGGRNRDLLRYDYLYSECRAQRVGGEDSRAGPESREGLRLLQQLSRRAGGAECGAHAGDAPAVTDERGSAAMKARGRPARRDRSRSDRCRSSPAADRGERGGGWAAEYLAARSAAADYQGELVHVADLPARAAAFAAPEPPLPPAIESLLARLEIPRLYTHQVEAIDPQARMERDVVVVTGTASGKSLAYHLPVLERLLADPRATALYLFPTKALAQDQLQGLERWAAISRRSPRSLAAGVYDGDTHRRTPAGSCAESANLILTNPDMLHQGILPHHTPVGRVLRLAAAVVVDEMHAYRGIFGSHVANVLRRLQRIAAHYGADPLLLVELRHDPQSGRAGRAARRAAR